jgi:hypothetical protein
MERDEKVAPLGQPVVGRRPGRGPGAFPVAEERVDHDVADEVHLRQVDALAGQVVRRVRARREEQVRKHIGDEAVHFLGHGAVAGAEASLDVSERNEPFCRHERGRHRRVDVTDHEDEVGALLFDHAVELDHHPGGLFAVACRPDAERDIGARHAELLEEDLRHGLVVVLLGVNEERLQAGRLPEGLDDRGHLHEVRPGPDDAGDLHASITRGSARSTRATRPT